MTNTNIITEIFKSHGMRPDGKKQIVNGVTVYPQIYFCPNNLSRVWGRYSKKSYTVHHFDQSWKANKTDQVSLKGRIRRYLIGKMRNVIGTKKVAKLGKMKR